MIISLLLRSSQNGRKNAQDPREVIVYNRGSGDMKHPVGGKIMEPYFWERPSRNQTRPRP